MKIYAVKIEPFKYELNKILPLLDPDRRARLENSKAGEKQLHSIYAGLLLHYAYINEHFSTPFEELKFKYGPHGKPYISDIKDFHYSISHSRDYVIIAVANTPVGIDIQYQDSYKENLAARFFTSKELQLLQSLPESSKSTCFYKLWSMKEACGKLIGDGIANNGTTRFTFSSSKAVFDSISSKTLFVQEYSNFTNYSCVCASTIDNAFPEEIISIEPSKLLSI